jgi:hypothetical protein
MKRKLPLIVLVIFVHLFSCFPKVHAEGEVNQRWFCFEAKRCDQTQCSGEGDNVHRVRLTTKSDKPEERSLPNTDTYIIECIATGDSQICTTGRAETDIVVYGRNNVQELASKIEYRFEGLFRADGKTVASNPSMSGNDGSVGPFEWQDSTPDSYARKFLGMNYFTAVGAGQGGAGGQQQGNLDFETAQKNCAEIHWDPYGRVFDSQTLEPIPDVKAELLKKRLDGTFTLFDPKSLEDNPKGKLAIKNPFTTKEDGIFSFIVPNGEYKLNIGSPNYTFPNVPAKLHPNYSKIYSDIYPNQTGEVINQQGVIEHRDIPLDSPEGTRNEAKLMEYFYELNKGYGSILVKGRASHPFTKIHAYARQRLITTVLSDKYGRFSLTIDKSQLKPGEFFDGVKLEKIDLTKDLVRQNMNLIEKIAGHLLKYVKPVEAQTQKTNTIVFDPIPNYLEGYAYDTAGKVIPNATVGIYLTFSNKPYFETKTDDKGYYQILSKNLPNMPYRIKYTSPTGLVIQKTTTQYLSDNAKYIADRKVDLNSYQLVNRETGKVITGTPPPKDQSGGFAESQLGGGAEGNARTAAAGSGGGNTGSNMTNLIMIGLILFTLITASAALITVYLIKKKQTPTQTPF